MTEYEYAELITSYATQGGTFFTIWLTILSAYALVAFFAGEKLNFSQIVALNSLYIFSASLAIFVFSGSFRTLVYYIKQLKLLKPDSPQIMNNYGTWAITIIAILGVFATLRFMSDVRHPKEK